MPKVTFRMVKGDLWFRGFWLLVYIGDSRNGGNGRDRHKKTKGPTTKQPKFRLSEGRAKLA